MIEQRKIGGYKFLILDAKAAKSHISGVRLEQVGETVSTTSQKQRQLGAHQTNACAQQYWTA